MNDSEFRRRRQQLLDRFLAGEIDQSSYDRMLGQLEEIESDSGSPQAKPDTSRGGQDDRTAHMSLGDHDTVAPAASSLTPGIEVGSYRLLEQLGRGGMGEVWKARDGVGDRDVVVKVLPPELQNSQDEMDRVRDVFHRVHALQHQHICPIYQLGQDPRVGYYLVMKFVEGNTLSRYRRDYLRTHDTFPLAEVLRVLQPTAAALDYAHSQKVVHRDVKPHNIMVGPRGDDPQLVDFGLAAEIRMSVTRISRVEMETSGTYPYMAPEQWKGEFQDGRTDQYALGAVAYELLSGQTPFHTPDALVLRQCVLSEEVPEIAGQPAHVNAALRKAMAKNRSDRFESCQGFIEAFRETVARPFRPPRPTMVGSGQLKSDIALELKEATAAMRQAGDLRSFLDRVAGVRMAQWRQAARQGIAGGQWLLGKCFEHGIGVDQSMPEAIDLYRQASRRGEPVAQVTLGNCFLRGKGLPQNSSKAVSWFRKAARKGDAFAATALGRCYLHGEGITMNVKEALKHLHKAAENGHPPAQVELGVCYAEGRVVPHDEVQAKGWLKLAADQGNQKAQQWLAHLESRQAGGGETPERTRLLAEPGTVDSKVGLPRIDALTDVESEITRKEDIMGSGLPTTPETRHLAGSAGMGAPTGPWDSSPSGSSPSWKMQSHDGATRNWLVPAIVATVAATLFSLLVLGGVYLIVQGLRPQPPQPIARVNREDTPSDDDEPAQDGHDDSQETVVDSGTDQTDSDDEGNGSEEHSGSEETDGSDGDDRGSDSGTGSEGDTDQDEHSADSGHDSDSGDQGDAESDTSGDETPPVVPVLPAAIGEGPFTDLAYVLSDSRIVAGNATGVSLWDATTGDHVENLGEVPGEVADLANTPNTNWVTIAGKVDANAGATDQSKMYSLLIWGLTEEFADSRFIYNGHDHRTLSACFSRSTLKMLTGDDAGDIIFWDTDTAKEVKFLQAPGTEVLCLDVADRDFFGISGHDDGTVRVWDLFEGREIHRYVGHTGPVNDVAIDKDRSLAVSAGSDGKLIVWDFSPSGSFWIDFEGEDVVRVLEGHTAAVTGVAITPDDRYAVSSSLDGTVRLWDLSDGTMLHEFEAGVPLNDVDVDNAQDHVAAAGDKIYIWDLPEAYRGVSSRTTN